MLTLRLVLSDGALALVRFPGGSVRPALRVPEVAGSTVRGTTGRRPPGPGQPPPHGQARAGTYRLARPLVLNQPVALLGAPGATLLFTKGPTSPRGRRRSPSTRAGRSSTASPYGLPGPSGGRPTSRGGPRVDRRDRHERQRPPRPTGRHDLHRARPRRPTGRRPDRTGRTPHACFGCVNSPAAAGSRTTASRGGRSSSARVPGRSSITTTRGQPPAPSATASSPPITATTWSCAGTRRGRSGRAARPGGSWC